MSAFDYPLHLRSKNSGLIVYAYDNLEAKIILNGGNTDYVEGEILDGWYFNNRDWEECPLDDIPD